VRPQRFAVMAALGEEFRSAREARGLTLSDVAEQIHIRSVYLNAIENEDWKAIGAPVYVRGFIRTYARFLGLDGEDAVARFNEQAPPDRPAHAASAAVDFGSDRERSGPSWLAIGGGLVALILVAFVVYEYWQYAKGGTASVPVAAASAAPQPAAVPAGSQSAAPSARPSASPAAAVHHQLAIRLVQRSWLRVTVDGATKIEGIFPAGTARTFAGSVAEVRAGNAGGVVVTVNGRSSGPMGKEGDVVEQRSPL
jgi:cytoskeleton protein RodZ